MLFMNKLRHTLLEHPVYRTQTTNKLIPHSTVPRHPPPVPSHTHPSQHPQRHCRRSNLQSIWTTSLGLQSAGQGTTACATKRRTLPSSDHAGQPPRRVPTWTAGACCSALMLSLNPET
jgi:hypothetical protein